MFKYLITRVLPAFLLLTLLFISCGEDRSIDLDDSLSGFEYFPVEEGRYWVYKVDSTIVDDAGATIVETSSYIREEIDGSFLNALGDKVYILTRSISDSPMGEFRITDAWSVEMNETAAIRTEENLRFIKLRFPISQNAPWNGNQFDDLTLVDVAGESIWVYKDWGDYIISDRNISMTVGGEEYNRVIGVEQADFESDIELRLSKEYYAPGVGLILKEMTILDTQCLCPGESWEEKAEAGFILRQTLIDNN